MRPFLIPAGTQLRLIEPHEITIERVVSIGRWLPCSVILTSDVIELHGMRGHERPHVLALSVAGPLAFDLLPVWGVFSQPAPWSAAAPGFVRNKNGSYSRVSGSTSIAPPPVPVPGRGCWIPLEHVFVPA